MPAMCSQRTDPAAAEETHVPLLRASEAAAPPAAPNSLHEKRRDVNDRKAVLVPEQAQARLRNGSGGSRSGSGSGSRSRSRSGSRSESDTSSEQAAPSKSKVPDGGWGWMVVFSSFIMSMIADGISFSFGLLLLCFLDHFQDSTSKTSWIGSLFMAVPLLSGPLGSALVDRYGCRSMTILGGVVSALGLILSCFAESVEMLMLTFGVLAGLGLGLCYVTCVVSIAFWFDKRRALATGMGAAGTGFGTFVFPPMTNAFIEYYGWRGAILLLAGAFLNMCVCGAVMRDPDWWVREQAAAAAAAGGGGGSSVASRSRRDSPCATSLADGATAGAALDDARRMLKMGCSPEEVLRALAAAPSTAPHAAAAAASSLLNLPTYVRQDETIPLEALETLSASKRAPKNAAEKSASFFASRSLSDDATLATTPLSAPPVIVPQVAPPKPLPLPSPPPPVVRYSPPPLIKQAMCGVAVEPSHYLKGIRVHRNSVMYRGAMLNIHKYKLRASSCPDIFRNSMTTIAQEEEEHWYTDVLSLLRGMTDFSLFSELHFTLMQLSTTLLFTWFIVPYFYLADYMTKVKHYTESEASWMLSIIGVTNTFGIVLLGWAGDQSWMHVQKTYAACLVMCGLSAIIMVPSAENIFALAVISGLFGLFFASSFSFTPVILVQLVPLERFTSAYGLVLLCQGVGNLIGPPLAGWLFDVTGHWDLAFYLTGLWIVVSGLLIAAIPLTKNHKLWGHKVSEKEIQTINYA